MSANQATALTLCEISERNVALEMVLLLLKRRDGVISSFGEHWRKVKDERVKRALVERSRSKPEVNVAYSCHISRGGPKYLSRTFRFSRLRKRGTVMTPEFLPALAPK